jgi:hypothetical protein
MFCHFYQLTGKCFKGEKCTFKHKDPVTYECLNVKRCPICKHDDVKDKGEKKVEKKVEKVVEKKEMVKKME